MVKQEGLIPDDKYRPEVTGDQNSPTDIWLGEWFGEAPLSYEQWPVVNDLKLADYLDETVDQDLASHLKKYAALLEEANITFPVMGWEVLYRGEIPSLHREYGLKKDEYIRFIRKARRSGIIRLQSEQRHRNQPMFMYYDKDLLFQDALFHTAVSHFRGAIIDDVIGDIYTKTIELLAGSQLAVHGKEQLSRPYTYQEPAQSPKNKPLVFR